MVNRLPLIGAVLACLACLAPSLSAQVNIAKGKTVTASANIYEPASFPITNITDGSAATFAHPATASSQGFFFTIDLTRSWNLTQLKLFNRQGCCPDRLSNYKVTLYADNGTAAPGAQTWTASVRTNGTNSGDGGQDTLLSTSGTGTFNGRWIRVQSLGTVPYSPQIAEVEAWTLDPTTPPAILYFVTDAGNITRTAADGLPAQATLSWQVQGATGVSIDQGIGPVAVSGASAVSPAAATSYVLSASNGAGTVTRTVTIAVDAAQSAPRVNEILADNEGGLTDDDGDKSDWIEIYNPNPFTLALAGAGLSDNAANPLKWTFPSGTNISPGGYLVVFASNKNRGGPGVPPHTNFQLSKTGETVSLSAPGGATLWSRIPGDYPATVTYPAQSGDTSYGINGSGQERYFRPPTPGAVNAATGYIGALEDTQFSIRRGLYSTPQSVAITCATPGATIRYTLNGTKPTESTGTVYTAPLSVGTTRVIRAAAFLPGYAPANVDTHTYIFPESVATQSAMLTSITQNATYGPQIPAALRDVPSISIVSATTAFNNDTETEGNIEFLHPTDSLSHAHAGAGITLFGGAFTDFAKKSFRFYFRGEYGDSKLTGPLFAGYDHGLKAAQEFDGLELRNGSHDMRDRGFYMSNLFTDQVLMEMGHLAPHGRFVHVYLNGAYWGLYHMRERWHAAMHSNYLGGNKEDYEAINGNYNVGGWATPGDPFDGDGAAWEYAKTKRTDYAEMSKYIDVANYTDFMIAWMFGNSEDEWRGVGPARFIGPAGGARFIMNDADGWLSINGSNVIAAWDTDDNNTARSSAWNAATQTFTAGRSAGDGPGSLLGAMYLTGGTEYRMLLADRIHRHLFNNGALTPAANAARLNAMCNEIERPFIGEAARWSNLYRTPASWVGAKNVCLNSWIPGRTAAVLTQFRSAGLYPTLNAPLYSQNGGIFSAGLNLTLTVTSPPAGAVIHYTLDGSDPRASGGAVAAGALTYAAPFPLTRNTIVRSRTRLPAGTWSALQEAFFQINTSPAVPPGAVVPSEIHYNPSGDDDSEFVELMNVSDGAVNLRGCKFTSGIDFTFSEYRDTLLAPGQRIVLVDSEFAHRIRYGWDRVIGGIYSDNLSNEGEGFTLTAGAVTVFDLTFSKSWYPLTDGGGRSLTLVKPRSGLDLSDAANWRPSQIADGSPGAGDNGPAFAGIPGADTDGDGATALIEYAAGTSDLTADSDPVLSIIRTPGGGFHLEYLRAAAPDDALIVPEAATDPADWHSGPDWLTTISEEPLPDGRIRVRLAPGASAGISPARLFFRLKVSQRL